MSLYWVAVRELPTKKEQEEHSQLPKLILPPTAVEARDDKDAVLKVALNNAALAACDKNRMEVLVRPF